MASMQADLRDYVIVVEWFGYAPMIHIIDKETGQRVRLEVSDLNMITRMVEQVRREAWRNSKENGS